MPDQEKKIRCDCCGKFFVIGNNADGVPNGIGVYREGQLINICADCINADDGRLMGFLAALGDD